MSLPSVDELADILFSGAETAEIPRTSYIRAYPYLLGYFAAKEIIEPADVVCGAHIAYGWMPTILELNCQKTQTSLADAALVLTRAQRNGALTNEDLQSLSGLINNSLVGASKLLHFVAPQHFAIWDSKVYRFVFNQRPYNHRLQNVNNYRHYLSTLTSLQAYPQFTPFHSSVNKKIGYNVTPLRALELMIFLQAPVS